MSPPDFPLRDHMISAKAATLILRGILNAGGPVPAQAQPAPPPPPHASRETSSRDRHHQPQQGQQPASTTGGATETTKRATTKTKKQKPSPAVQLPPGSSVAVVKDGKARTKVANDAMSTRPRRKAGKVEVVDGVKVPPAKKTRTV